MAQQKETGSQTMGEIRRNSVKRTDGFSSTMGVEGKERNNIGPEEVFIIIKTSEMWAERQGGL